MADNRRRIEPSALKWQDNGELAAQDVFNLVCRLREVEESSTSNELWRLGQKYPTQNARAQSSSAQNPTARNNPSSHKDQA